MHLLDIHEPGQSPLPHTKKNTAIGIDLGTTNSLVAYASGQSPHILTDNNGHKLLPSVVAYLADGRVLTGRDAQAHIPLPQESVIRSIKRLMGRGLNDVKALAGQLPFQLSDMQEEGGMVRLNVAGRSISPVEISAEILRSLKKRAETALGEEVNEAVITVPAYFDDAARTATKDAARLAGLTVLRLVNEPTAAALAYGLDKGAEGIYAVYDLGGGTFDISLLRMEKGVFQVLATGGDTALGGDDFDHALAEYFYQEHQKDNASFALNPRSLSALLGVAREVKEALSGTDSYQSQCNIGEVQLHCQVTRSGFEAMILPAIERSLMMCEQVLDDAGISKDEVKGVVLVGGSTRIPFIREQIEAFFGQPPLTDVDPDTVVAAGAALQAEGLTQGSGNLLLDVAPLSLGIEIMGGMVEKVIPRNTSIPVAIAQEFTTYQDGQTGMKIHVLQGEREMAQDCRSLARFELKNIPPMKAGVARIKVTFTVDADGLLTVAAQEETTGTTQEVAVKPTYGLEEGAIIQMLYDSMAHARDDMEKRLLAEARTEASRSIVAVEQALTEDIELLSASELEVLQTEKLQLETLVQGSDRDAINAQAKKLEEAAEILAERQMDKHVGEALKGLNVTELEERLTELNHATSKKSF